MLVAQSATEGIPLLTSDPIVAQRPRSRTQGVTRRRRYGRMTEVSGGKGFFVENPEELCGNLDEAMNFRGPALINVLTSQGSAS